MSHETSEMHYVKTWALLLVLLVISILGPMLQHEIVTLITAFGVAIVKAVLVARNFMHINIEKKFISYIILGMLICDGVFFLGVAPDVMKSHGTRWEKKVMHAPVSEAHEAEHPKG